MRSLVALLLSLAPLAHAETVAPKPAAAPAKTPEKSADKAAVETCHAACAKTPADPAVVRDCAALTTKDECAEFVSDRFPYKCDWGKPDAACNAP